MSELLLIHLFHGGGPQAAGVREGKGGGSARQLGCLAQGSGLQSFYVSIYLSIYLSIYIYIYTYVYREREICLFACVFSDQRAGHRFLAPKSACGSSRGGGPLSADETAQRHSYEDLATISPTIISDIKKKKRKRKRLWLLFRTSCQRGEVRCRLEIQGLFVESIIGEIVAKSPYEPPVPFRAAQAQVKIDMGI